jgi:hypothetical protein
MKTEKQLKTEIKEVLSEIQEADKFSKRGKKLIKKAKQKLTYLKTCLAYIETHPSPEFIQKEIERLSNRINLLDTQYDEWKNLPRKDVIKGNLKTFYLKKVDVPHLKNQIKTLKFISK